jgi:hypothetical protein
VTKHWNHESIKNLSRGRSRRSKAPTTLQNKLERVFTTWWSCRSRAQSARQSAERIVQAYTAQSTEQDAERIVRMSPRSGPKRSFRRSKDPEENGHSPTTNVSRLKSYPTAKKMALNEQPVKTLLSSIVKSYGHLRPENILKSSVCIES